MTQDNTLALQGEVSIFYARQDDLTHLPVFAGLFGYQVVDSLTKSLGELNPVQVPSAVRANTFNLVRVTRSAPDLGEFTIMERISRNTFGILERTAKNLCQNLFILRLGECARPDQLSEWDSLIIVQGAQAGGDFDAGTLKQFDGNDPLEFNITYNHLGWERILPVYTGEKADAILTREVLDIAYAGEASCGFCSAYTDGCEALYALTNNLPSSPGLSSALVYTTDGSTYNSVDIQALAGNSGTALNVVGSYLVVVSEAGENHVYINRSSISATGWSAVSTGYVASNGPLCIFALAPQLVFIGAENGYVYKSSDITSSVTVVSDGSETTEDLHAIHAAGQTVVAVGDNNAVLVSNNLGTTWTALTGPAVGVNLNTVWVLNQNQWYIGTNDGKLWYTTDGGTTWTERGISSAITSIEDLAFAPDFSVVGALVAVEGAASYIYRTYDGGRTWSRQVPAIRNLGTAPQRYNAVAVCGTHNIAAGGLMAALDGVIAVAEADDA